MRPERQRHLATRPSDGGTVNSTIHYTEIATISALDQLVGLGHCQTRTSDDAAQGSGSVRLNDAIALNEELAQAQA
jgi:hypothetical protein